MAPLKCESTHAGCHPNGRALMAAVQPASALNSQAYDAARGRTQHANWYLLTMSAVEDGHEHSCGAAGTCDACTTSVRMLRGSRPKMAQAAEQHSRLGRRCVIAFPAGQRLRLRSGLTTCTAHTSRLRALLVLPSGDWPLTSSSEGTAVWCVSGCCVQVQGHLITMSLAGPSGWCQ
jgi:ferredoxin